MSQSLILLIPLLVLAAVALFAFAGCGLDVVGTAPAPGETPPGETPATYEDTVKATTGLIAYWRLGEAKLPADPYPPAADIGPNNLPGTYHGPVVIGGATGALVAKEPADKAAVFNSDGYVEVPWKGVLSPPLAFTLEAWIHPGALTSPSTDQHVAAFRNVEPGGVNTGFELNVNRTAGTSRIFGRAGSGGGAVEAVEAYLEIDDAKLGPGADWFHVVVTYDGADPGKPLILYVNGDAGGPNQKQLNVEYGRNLQQPLRIGAGRAAASPDPGELYVGGIDEVALYGVALADATVKKHYQLSGR